MAEKEIATLNGLILKCETFSDGFRKAIVQHPFPSSNRAELQDQGLNPRTVRLRCYFWGDTYQRHFDLLGLLKGQDRLELEHPHYGRIQGYVELVDVRHDDRDKLAEVDLTFIEELLDESSIIAEEVQGATEGQLKEGFSQQETELADDIRDDLGTEAESLLDKTIDSSQGIIEQVTGLSVTVRAYVGEIDGLVSSLEGTLGDIANPANSLIGSISFATNLPGRIVGAIAETAERYAILYESLRASPELFVRGLGDGMTELKNSLGLNDAPSSKATPKTAAAQTNAKNLISKQIDIAVALVVSQKVGEIYAADETDRNTVRRAEEVSAFDVLGNYRGANPLPEILSITELERSLATVRTHIQSAVDQARGMQALHDMAKSLLRHVNEIKLERERIIEVELTEETPLQLVCLQYGLPYNYAERILTLNPQIKNPNFASGTIKIYASH